MGNVSGLKEMKGIIIIRLYILFQISVYLRLRQRRLSNYKYYLY